MVVGKALDNLKDKPHEEKKVVATGVAVGVVLVLLVGWGFLFMRKIQRGTMPTLEGSAVPQDQIDAAFIRDTQQQINQFYQSQQDQLRDIRDNAAANSAPGGANAESVSPYDNVDGFGAE